MKVAIIHSVSGKSAEMLREYLEFNGISAVVRESFKDGNENYAGYDYVFSMGCSAPTRGAPRINKILPVTKCVSKVMTFSALERAGIPTVEWTTEYKKITKEWDQVCVRESFTERAGNGISYYYRDEKIPKDAALYTRVHYGEVEYRIVVFNGEIVGRYLKNSIDDGIIFQNMPSKGFKSIDNACLDAASVLGIDYVGFDVLAHSKKDFVILEANSGAILTEEAALAITQYFLNLKG